ncbi:MAG: hypothetical protein U0166_23275 [Acidobacteriota bacterium]
MTQDQIRARDGDVAIARRGDDARVFLEDVEPIETRDGLPPAGKLEREVDGRSGRAQDLDRAAIEDRAGEREAPGRADEAEKRQRASRPVGHHEPPRRVFLR